MLETLGYVLVPDDATSRETERKVKGAAGELDILATMLHVTGGTRWYRLDAMPHIDGSRVLVLVSNLLQRGVSASRWGGRRALPENEQG